MRDEDASLAALGLSHAEELVYRQLLRSPTASVASLSQELGISRRLASSAVASLEQHGLVSRNLGRTPQYRPTPPDVGIETLILRRQAELSQTRSIAGTLMADFHTGRETHGPELIETISGDGAVQKRFEQLQRGAHVEVHILDTPPYSNPNRDGTPNQAEIDGLRRGVTYRTIYAKAALESAPGAIDAINRYVGAGEQARFVNHVPLKIAIIDGDYGLVPLSTGQSDTSCGIVLHACSLLDVLLNLFNELWARAVPVPLRAQKADFAQEPPNHTPATDAQQRLLGLLLAGLSDKAIANHLGQSYRTARRRTASLLHDLEAETPFQAGAQAVRRGWL